MPNQTIIVEKDVAGRTRRTQVLGDKIQTLTRPERRQKHVRLLEFIAKVFLPANYPDSVAPGYLRYQILNALQAFCNSLAGMLSSRAILEGFGVGDASATATHALFLTVLQDIFGRLTTIFAAYFVGSSLYPEAKMYRLLADVLNDGAVILDTLSPLLISPALPIQVPGLRIAALCMSAALRSLCGIAAGGSKAAITLHFATPMKGTGDVGDLNAKDASKETVLALLGMLLGTLVVPRLTTPGPTYVVLFLLVGLHLVINYMGVRGLGLRSLNRQRSAMAWMTYRTSMNSKIPLPAEISQTERIFERPGTFRDVKSGLVIGYCTIGSSLSSILRHPIPSQLLDLFSGERYLLWYDHRCLSHAGGVQAHKAGSIIRLHICLKDGYTQTDQLKAWVHAAELCRIAAPKAEGDHEAFGLIQRSHLNCAEHFSDFIHKMRGVGWNTTDSALMTGPPEAVLTSTEAEEKKSR